MRFTQGTYCWITKNVSHILHKSYAVNPFNTCLHGMFLLNLNALFLPFLASYIDTDSL